MLFPEKLYQLRKERNLSQEALAEKLGTTRQAVSKWENGQGYPETEKLLLLAQLFQVSVDYLLKDTPTEAAEQEAGYYVSREMAEGYLSNQKRWSRRFATGAAVLLLCVTPFLRVKFQEANPVVLICLAVLGACLALRGVLSDDSQYQVLEREPLLFDGVYGKELQGAYHRMKGRYLSVFGLSFVGFMVSIFVLNFNGRLFFQDFTAGIPAYLQLAVAVLALSAAVLLYTGVMLESYSLLANNQDHVKGLWFRLRRKLRKKTDTLLK